MSLQITPSFSFPSQCLIQTAHLTSSSQGYTRFSTFSDLSSPTAADWDTTYRVNVLAQTHLLRAASDTFNANPDGGVFLMTSSIAGISTSGSSMPYSVSKAAQLHLMKCLAVTQGRKIRINAILPGLLLTEWGMKFGEEKVKQTAERSLLGKVVSLIYLSWRGESLYSRERLIVCGLVDGFG
jgi:NAD(P)-dependent dehydrogenase (short-subunit alcohol dehydrogenase family)